MMDKRTKTQVNSLIDEFVSNYAKFKGLTLEEAEKTLQEFGAMDFMLRWFPILGHASPEQVSERLDKFVTNKKELRKKYAL
jgi:hypothetical protein